MEFLGSILHASWELFEDAAIYILFGIMVGGMLRVFLSPAYVAHHLGRGRFSSVLKAAFFGIPIPLCSCGVLPAAAALKKQGANNGATTAFLISTPESGIDSISITYALLDPIMTVARPLAAFFSAAIAGCLENFFIPPRPQLAVLDRSCTVDGCCDGSECPPEEHAAHHTFGQRFLAGLRFAVDDLWGDIAGWFFIGLLLGGLITVLVPDDLISLHLGGGIIAMLLMLAIGVPLYICATASTPIAAALILKGVSPGVALVFLLVGPATNITSLTVLIGLLGKRATLLYLATIAVCSVLCGLLVDQIYGWSGISAQAVIGQAGDIIPAWAQLAGTVILLLMSIKPLGALLGRWFKVSKNDDGCGCTGGSCTLPQQSEAPDKPNQPNSDKL